VPYITAEELRGRLPLDGEGLSDSQVQGPVAAAIEYIAGLTGDTEGNSPLLQEAVINHAMAYLFDTLIYPQDARRPGTESSALSKSVDNLLEQYRTIHTDVDKDMREDVPDGYIGVLNF
jgi:hypothetical protein